MQQFRFVGLDTLSLSRIYHMDLFSLRLCRLEIKCFTDTCSAGVKSLVGKICARLFTDGEYIYIYIYINPSKSKK